MGRLVTVILITWNSARYLRACTEGIRAQTWPDLEIIVVDNASTDDSLAIVRDRLPGATVISNTSNRGFSVAVNQALAKSHGEFVLLLNPDARLQSDYLRLLIDALDSAGAEWGSATGRLLRGEGASIVPTGRVDSLGIRMTRSGRHFDIGTDEPDPGPGAPREVFGVSGAAALHRRIMLDDLLVGGEYLAECFFAYREDADLAWRARLRGWRALVVPEALGWHVRLVTPEGRGKLSAEINMHSVKNRFLLRLRNQGRVLALRHALLTIIRDLVVIGASLTIERTSLPAFRWLWDHRQEILRERKRIQSRRTVSDEQLAGWFR